MERIFQKRSLPENLPLRTEMKEEAIMSVPFIDFIKWADFEVKEVGIKRFIGEDGKPTKKFDNSIAPNTYEVYLSNNWWCIDIDVAMRHYPAVFQSLPYTVSSSKKRHYYAQINADITDFLGTKSAVDVLDFELSKEEQVYNNKEHGIGDTLKKMWEAKDTMLYCPSGMVDFQNSYFKLHINRLLPFMKIPQTTLKASALLLDDNTSNAPDEKESCYSKILKLLGSDWFNPYDNWNKVMWCLPNDESSKILFHEWSSQSSKYNEASVDAKWEACKIRNQFGFQTLLKYIKIENPESASKLCDEFRKNKRSVERNLVEEFHHTSIANYFYQSHKKGYIFFRSWYELNSFGVWVEADANTPYQLREEMYEYVAKKLLEFNIAVASDETITEDVRKKLHGKICDARMKLGKKDWKDCIVKELEGKYLDRQLFDKLNANRHLFAFNDCLIDLNTSIIRKIEPSDYISFTCGYNYTTENTDNTQRALGYLNTMFKTQEDMKFAIKCMASCLRGENYFEKFFCFSGKGGNGKGCFFDAMAKVFGNYWGIIPMDYWYNSTSRDALKADTIAISVRTKRVLYSVEAQEAEDGDNSLTLCVPKMKTWTGKDTIKCRDNFAKSKEMIEFVPHGTPIHNTNVPHTMPLKDKTGDAIKRRMTVSHFPYTFVESESDVGKNPLKKVGNPEVKKQLQTDEMRNTLIHILINSYNTEIKGKSAFTLTDDAKASTSAYIDNETENVKKFMTETFEITSEDGDKINRPEIFDAYKCCDTVIERLKATDFYNILTKLEYKSAKVKGTNYFKCLKLKTDGEPDSGSESEPKYKSLSRLPPV